MILPERDSGGPDIASPGGPDRPATAASATDGRSTRADSTSDSASICGWVVWLIRQPLVVADNRRGHLE